MEGDDGKRLCLYRFGGYKDKGELIYFVKGFFLPGGGKDLGRFYLNVMISVLNVCVC